MGYLTLTSAVILSLTLTSTTLAQTTECRPGDNCLPPNCRCWNDNSVPGNIALENTPQVVMVTFEYALTADNSELYKSLFEGIVNPNNCPAVGSFYVQQTSTNLSVVKAMSDAGHEIGVTTVDGQSPDSPGEWNSDLSTMKQTVVTAGVPANQVVGVRAPELKPGGNDEFTALASQGFLYDSSCTSSRFDGYDGQVLWPYTYDFAPGPTCDYGEGPENRYPGRWQVLVADLEFNGTKCATPQACLDVATDKDAFNIFFNSFIKHYEGNKSPFLMIINPDWAATDFKREGTRQFLEYIRAAFEDTWILTTRQALEWMKNPVPNDQTKTFQPWGC